jgi:23S rRNA pseudouridine1911/1915/1917 synthase
MTLPLPDIREVEAGAADAGRRLDAFLAARLPELSRARLQRLVRAGHLRLGDEVVAEASARVKAGQRFRLSLPPPKPAVPAPEDVPLEILHEDAYLLVLVKPAGMVVHPAPGHAAGTLVNALLGHCGAGLSGIGGVARPGIVHRLDRDVSGVMVVAKTDTAHRSLAGQFTVHTVERAYDGIVWGVPSPSSGLIDAPIGRHPRDRQRMAVVERNGKPARTVYRVMETMALTAALVRCELLTGRTHQIRVHLAHRGHGLVGDPVYGRRPGGLSEAAVAELQGFGRIALHARVLGFGHPASGAPMRFEVPPPATFGALVQTLARERAIVRPR